MLSHIACAFMTPCDLLCLVVPDLFSIFTYLCLRMCLLQNKRTHTHTLSCAESLICNFYNKICLINVYVCVFTLIYILRIHSLRIPKHYVRFVWYVHVVFYCLFVYSWFYLCFSECVFRHLMCIQLSHHRHWGVKIHNVCILAMIASPFSYVYCILHKL